MHQLLLQQAPLPRMPYIPRPTATLPCRGKKGELLCTTFSCVIPPAPPRRRHLVSSSRPERGRAAAEGGRAAVRKHPPPPRASFSLLPTEPSRRRRPLQELGATAEGRRKGKGNLPLAPPRLGLSPALSLPAPLPLRPSLSSSVTTQQRPPLCYPPGQARPRLTAGGGGGSRPSNRPCQRGRYSPASFGTPPRPPSPASSPPPETRARAPLGQPGSSLTDF